MEISVTHWGCIVLLFAKPWAADTGCVIAEMFCWGCPGWKRNCWL